MELKLGLKEELSSVETKIQGTFPTWLEGTLIRNGPTNVSIAGKTPTHWFDGLAMLHAFAFQEGKVRYSNRFLRTEAYKAVMEGSLDYLGFACDPCRTLFSKFFTKFFPSSHFALHNANVNVASIKEAYVALTETPLPVRFDVKTLETLGVLDYEDTLVKRDAFESAHPHYLASSGTTINYLVNFGLRSNYTIYQILKGTSTRIPIATVPVKNPAYMHSFSFTENYIILTEYPFLVNPWDFLFKNRPFITNYRWLPEHGTHFLVINRRDGTVVGRYPTSAFFSFHHANAFEKGADLILDAVTYPDASVIINDLAEYTEGKNQRLLSLPEMCLKRFRLSLATGKIEESRLTDVPFEFPRIHTAQNAGRPYRFVYGIDPRDLAGKDATRPIYKVDVESGKTWQWQETGCYPGEAIFVGKPQSSTEDEGVLLSIILDMNTGLSFLLALDASSFQEIGRATVPHQIPPGLHSQFFT